MSNLRWIERDGKMVLQENCITFAGPMWQDVPTHQEPKPSHSYSCASLQASNLNCDCFLAHPQEPKKDVCMKWCEHMDREIKNDSEIVFRYSSKTMCSSGESSSHIRTNEYVKYCVWCGAKRPEPKKVSVEDGLLNYIYCHKTKNVAGAAIEFMKARMPKPITSKSCIHDGAEYAYNKAISDVRRDLFGDES